MEKISDTLNKNQREILTGLLLGDGHLETRNNGRTYRLKVEHSSEQSDYTEWLYQVFKNLCEQTELYRRERSDGRVSVGFTTRTIGSFRFYGQQFYVDKQKRIPPLIHTLLSPQTVSVWFMDDGSRKSNKHNTYNIHTLGYTKSDLEMMQEKLLTTLDIKVALHAQRNSTWRLYIGTDSADKFTQMIKPFVEKFSSMNKKLVNKMPKS
jgi:hypothetical protein